MQTLSRPETFAALRDEMLDLLVIGGGITGAGVAREAGLRGLKVGLVEANDFASGTSSRSSRLVHGGVRYLEHGELRLVFEASRERRTLLRIAPHLVHPLRFTWPVYAGARLPRWKLGAGLYLYDLLALFRNVGRHRRLSRKGVLRHEPRVLAEQLTGGASYWDAATDDVRLTLANIRSAQEAGAWVVNHARVTALAVQGDRVGGATVRDELTGEHHPVRARCVVNAAGPWSDEVEQLANVSTAPAVRGSKGVHINVSRERVGNVEALTLLAPQDGRVFFVLPAGDFAIIGTTDTFENVSPDKVRASESDVDYLLTAANHFFPDARLVRDDVVSAWAGLRPLAAEGAAATPGATSREHAIHENIRGLVQVTGGKLTTYRAMAVEVVDRALESIGMFARPSRSEGMPLHGGAITDFAGMLAQATTTIGDEAVALRLLTAHGTAWTDVWNLVRGDRTLGARIVPERPYVMAELVYARQQEMAMTLGDLLIRRVPLAFETRDHGLAAARQLALDAGELAEYVTEVEAMFSVEA